MHIGLVFLLIVDQIVRVSRDKKFAAETMAPAIASCEEGRSFPAAAT
jgi:hypothetical protein